MPDVELPKVETVIDWIQAFKVGPKDSRLEIIDRMVVAHPTLQVEFAGIDDFTPPGQYITRVRKIARGEEPIDFQGVIWPPLPVPGSGRASGEQFPVTYLSRHPFTAFAEKDVTNDYCVVAHFVTRPSAQYVVSPIGEYMRIIRSGVSELLHDKMSHIVDEMMKLGPEASLSLFIF